jgi:hypothetical protein
MVPGRPAWSSSNACSRNIKPWKAEEIIVKVRHGRAALDQGTKSATHDLSAWPGDLRNDGGSVAAAGGDGSET